MTDRIELLTLDENGHAVEGPLYPRDRGVIKYMDEDYKSDPRTRLAYPHKFFRYDDHGQPIRETLVEFLVPGWMCDGARPGYVALAAVGERMGWGR